MCQVPPPGADGLLNELSPVTCFAASPVACSEPPEQLRRFSSGWIKYTAVSPQPGVARAQVHPTRGS